MFKKTFRVLLVIVLVAAAIFLFEKYQAHKLKQEQHQNSEKNKTEEISITLIEGWSNKEIGDYLQKQGIVTSVDFLQTIKSYDTTEYDSFLPKEAKGKLQGFLYPDTYRLFKSTADRSITPAAVASEQILTKLLNNFKIKLPKDAENLAKKQGLSLYEAITLASIVENETGRNAFTAEQKAKLDEERKIIAGIFYNRLNSGVALQSDATINYITNKKDPAVSQADLEISSPYNTYRNKGLPPTPISNPSLSSILAVLEPAKTDYFYFLHKQPSGEAVYSKTFEEHVVNKQKYLR